ncbi:bifunctional nuclease family protein [Salibacteraceae bacterium]|nr:bifunctional nuclease family protein [Salibacteraceae bacterium]MDB9725503.1 bifunctional nuclease family protein [Salibacteraceae bacterium]MDC1204317.1 bifunctional nuclease family protein [Salibacteraceae bacterium]
MEDKIRLEISGLSYSQAQTGAYALVLSETEGNRSLPIIIGSFEAQAIAIELESMKPSRPLTHDVFKTFADEFKIDIKEVIIYNLKEGVFFARLICMDKHSQVSEIDARTSDAIALSVRFKCPVYTHEFILKDAGVIIDEDAEIRPAHSNVEQDIADAMDDTEGETSPSNPIKSKTAKQLEEMLQDALLKEDYEFASKIRDEIDRRN